MSTDLNGTKIENTLSLLEEAKDKAALEFAGCQFKTAVYRCRVETIVEICNRATEFYAESLLSRIKSLEAEVETSDNKNRKLEEDIKRFGKQLSAFDEAKKKSLELVGYSEELVEENERLRKALQNLVDATEDKNGQFRAWHQHLRQMTKEAEDLLANEEFKLVVRVAVHEPGEVEKMRIELSDRTFSVLKERIKDDLATKVTDARRTVDILIGS